MNKKDIEKFIIENLDEWLGKTLTISSISEEIERRYQRTQEALSHNLSTTQMTYNALTETQSKMNILSEEISRYRKKIDEMNSTISDRAMKDDVARIEQQVAQKCPLQSFENLKENMNRFVKSEELHALANRQNSFENSLSTKFFNKKSAHDELSAMKRELLMVFHQYATKEELQDRVNQLIKKNSDIKKEIKDLDFRLNNTQNVYQMQIATLKEVITQKSDKDDNVKIWEELRNKATNEQLKSLLNELKPKVLMSVNRVSEFIDCLQSQEDALRRIDEVLLGKASKIDIVKLNEKVDRISKHADLEDKIDQMIKDLKDYTHCTRDHIIDIKKLKANVSEMMLFYSKHINNNAEFTVFKQEINEIQIGLTYKADRSEVLCLLEHKTEQTDHCKVQEELDQVIKHLRLVVAQIKAMQQVLADPSKVHGPEKVQREFLCKVTQKLSDMIDKPVKNESERKIVENNYFKRSKTPTFKSKTRIVI